MTQNQCVGKSIHRIDAFDKVTGQAKYVGDLTMPGMLYGKILRSPIAHGIIKKIDTSKAKALLGVRAVITYLDVPQIPFTVCGHPYPDDTPRDSRILDMKVRYVGDAVAAVAADTIELAELALSLIEVEFQELPAYFTCEDALQADAVEIHKGSNNLTGDTSYNIGDVDKAFAEADYVVEDEFQTPIVTHSPIENHVSLVYLESDGRLVVHFATQAPHILRRQLSVAFGLPIGKVQVKKSFVGGGFGGKQEAVQEPINAALALAAKKPVRLELTREEVIATTRTRHAMVVKWKTGVTKEGQILGREIQIIANTGAYSSHGHNVCLNMASQFAPLYPTPNLRFSGKTVYTNILVAGAMRGYGIPQLNFTMEAHLDNIAHKLDLDPIDFRSKNLCKEGDCDAVTNIKINTCGLSEAIEEGKQKIYWEEKRSQPGEDIRKKRGLGMACFSYAQSTYPHNVELSGARVMLNEDCTATLFLGCAEIGQGTDTVMKQIAAESLGIPFEWIKVIAVDTDICPFDVGAYASRQTYVSGMAVKKAALAYKKDLLEVASRILSWDVEKLDTRNGWVIAKITGKRLVEMKEVAMGAVYSFKSPMTISHDAYFSPVCNALTFGVTFAEVSVDTTTGKVEVVKLVSVTDCGKLINPPLAEGQVIGGNIMSFGYGVMEQVLVDPKTGKVLNDNLLDYKIPTMADIPKIEAYFIETDEPSSAFGNKSLGEPPNIAPAPAIRNAVLNAVGIEINQLPLTPQRVLSQIKQAEFQQRGIKECI
jgi:xanthine dehydrogenase molybdenum-binding subunit